MKRYVIIAGVNGVGKSTLYQTLSGIHKMERVNTDEIVSEIGVWNNLDDVIRANALYWS